MLEHFARELDAGKGVRLWLVRLDDDATHDELLSLLSSDERERAASYPGTTRARRFVRGRGALRVVLGEMAGVPPADLRFAYGHDGKPSLAEASGAAASALHFNVSHARDLALIVVAHGRRVGVDIAWARGEMRLGPVVERFFSSPERTAFDAVAEGEGEGEGEGGRKRRDVFTRIWVRKEAYLKGRGEGISERIYDTDFSVLAATEGDRAFRGACNCGMRDQDQWRVLDVDGLPDGFMASVALERLTT